ncbi:MAG TPA: L-seryl-tRNA(Sec) selenium transferase [Actinomycetota bacterium]|nr:L-seryl-tRNA(Sec) selenium transferase [Actinomycetota bacterium]
MADADLLRKVPQVDAVLREPAVRQVETDWGHAVARRLVADELESERARARRGTEPADATTVAARVAERAADLDRRRLRRVINATGVVLHTNLGRAPLSAAATEAAREAAGYVNLEFDLGSGERGSRAPVASTILAALTGAESALVVNNNAGALLLALATLGRGREVVVSRGELIEIGGEFRLPEIMEASGALLREVGTTNRTHAKDYRRAIGDGTALVLKVHPSNYRVVGFTKEPPLADVLAIAHETGVPLLYDIGSGRLQPDDDGEPDASSAIAAGCDLVCFSGDKLFGGPQAGVLAGSRILIEACRRNPIARAVRADKLTLAAMEATAIAHARGEAGSIPAGAAMASSEEDLHARAERIVAALPPGDASIAPGESVVGGGSLPGTTLPTSLLAFAYQRPEVLAATLRGNDPPVIGRIDGGRFVVDLRTVDPADDPILLEALAAGISGRPRTV